MTFSTNEIRIRAAQFAEDWNGATREKSESQTFWNEFFEIFGIKRRNVAKYEEQVIKLNDNEGKLEIRK